MVAVGLRAMVAGLGSERGEGRDERDLKEGKLTVGYGRGRRSGVCRGGLRAFPGEDTVCIAFAAPDTFMTRGGGDRRASESALCNPALRRRNLGRDVRNAVLEEDEDSLQWPTLRPRKTNRERHRYLLIPPRLPLPPHPTLLRALRYSRLRLDRSLRVVYIMKSATVNSDPAVSGKDTGAGCSIRNSSGAAGAEWGVFEANAFSCCLVVFG
ncbi:hypothetical protein R3P38DRAFT_2792323 [Favolaschia claudopus]|uniref:Uncharacterized protein n=1 Tax=Favolaschia claudopus TaxID=2862362 RepID=A0AAW0AEU0_9AGAR